MAVYSVYEGVCYRRNFLRESLAKISVKVNLRSFREEEVMVMRRLYTCLKCKPDYKKRVTWIEKAAKGMDITCTGKVVVEYVGTFPSSVSMHGNSKKGSCSEYVRTSESTKSKIVDRVKNEQPRNIFL